MSVSRLNVILSGMTGSTKVESPLLEIAVTSIAESVSVELSDVRAVKTDANLK